MQSRLLRIEFRNIAHLRGLRFSKKTVFRADAFRPVSRPLSRLTLLLLPVFFLAVCCSAFCNRAVATDARNEFVRQAEERNQLVETQDNVNEREENNRDDISAEITSAQSISDEATLADTLAKIEQLITELGAVDFETRRNASEELLAAGQAAVEPLTQARLSPDSEIRFRVSRILVLIEQAAFDQRLDLFLSDDPADRALAARSPLEGWPEFAAIAGEAKETRELYARLYGLYPALFGNIENGCWNHNQDQKNEEDDLFGSSSISIDVFYKTVAGAFLFSIAAPVPSDNPDQSDADLARLKKQREGRTIMLLTRMNDSRIRTYVDTGGFRPVFNSVCSRWINSISADDSAVAQKIIDAVNASHIEYATRKLAEIAGDEDFDADLRSSALRTICLTGARADVARIAGLIGSDLPVGRYAPTEQATAPTQRVEIVNGVVEIVTPTSQTSDRQSVEVRLGDVALATAVLLSGEAPDRFGLQLDNKEDKRDFNIHHSGFASAANRSRARAEWSEFYSEFLQPAEDR